MASSNNKTELNLPSTSASAPIRERDIIHLYGREVSFTPTNFVIGKEEYSDVIASPFQLLSVDIQCHGTKMANYTSHFDVQFLQSGYIQQQLTYGHRFISGDYVVRSPVKTVEMDKVHKLNFKPLSIIYPKWFVGPDLVSINFSNQNGDEFGVDFSYDMTFRKIKPCQNVNLAGRRVVDCKCCVPTTAFSANWL